MKNWIKKYKEIIIVLGIILIVILFQWLKVIKSDIFLNKDTVTISQADHLQNHENIMKESNCIRVNEKTNNQTDEVIMEEEKRYSMQTGDRFAKVGNVIVYVNDFDNAIWIFDIEQKTYKKLAVLEDGVQKIYFDGKNIFCMPSYYRGKGIYQIDLQGNVQKIYEGASLQLWLTEDNIYFIDQIGYDTINQTPQGNLCVMHKDGSHKQTIISNVKNYFSIHNNNIYYTDQSSRNLYKANIDGTEKVMLATGRTYITSVTDDFITYLDYSDGEKHRVFYFASNENHVLGRFGNIHSAEEGIYSYTRKLIGEDNQIENAYTLSKIENTGTETEIWRNEVPLEYLCYVYHEYAYFDGNNSIYRIHLTVDNPEKEQLEIRYPYFIGGSAYSFKSKEDCITELDICHLDSNQTEKIEIH